MVCWRHLAAAMGQASHAEREESGAHRRPGLPPFLPRTWVRAPPPLRKPIRDSVASPRSSSMWRIGGRGHCLLTYPSFSTSHAFSVAPQVPWEGAHTRRPQGWPSGLSPTTLCFSRTLSCFRSKSFSELILRPLHGLFPPSATPFPIFPQHLSYSSFRSWSRCLLQNPSLTPHIKGTVLRGCCGHCSVLTGPDTNYKLQGMFIGIN